MPAHDYEGPAPMAVSRSQMRQILRARKKAGSNPTSDHTLVQGKPVVAVETPDGMGVFSVAEVVLVTFVGPRPSPTAVADHIDGNLRNCAAANLRWVEPSTAPNAKVVLAAAVGAAAVVGAVAGLASP